MIALTHIPPRFPALGRLQSSVLHSGLSRRRGVMTHASLNLLVKGNPETKVLGDCPFCHRVMLVMEQKQLEYDRVYVDLKNKPQWLFDINPEGTVPILKDDGKYIPDSGAIVEYLEKKFPVPEVPESAEDMEAVNEIFGAFRAYFMSQDTAEQDELKAALHTELMKLEERLNQGSSPFLGGTTFNAADVLVLPRLYHMRVVLGHYKQWTIPDDCPKVKTYIEAAMETDVWKRCEYSPDVVIEGWGAKLEPA